MIRYSRLRLRLTEAVGLAVLLGLLLLVFGRPADPPPTPIPVPLAAAEHAAALERADALDPQVDKLVWDSAYAEALPLARESLALRERALGPDHPLTGASLYNLARLLVAMGDYPEAKPLYERTVAISERSEGLSHASTGVRVSNLASLLEDMGEYAEAKPLYERALAISEGAEGPDALSTGTSLHNLARLLRITGDYAGAKPLAERALAIAEKVEGPDDPSTGRRLRNLASLLRVMGDSAAAKPLAERALAIAEKAQGPEGPSTGVELNNLAFVLEDLGDFAGAKPLYERSLAISEKEEGPNHPSTATSLHNLARLLQAMGDHEAAKPLAERALAISEKEEGPDRPSTALRLVNLGRLLQTMGDDAGAKPLFERALAISEKGNGPDHPLTGAYLDSLAGLLQTTGDYAGAKPLLERSLAISEKAEGPDHPSTGTGLQSLAGLLQAMGDHAGARPLYERALRIAEAFLRRESLSLQSAERLALARTHRWRLDDYLAGAEQLGSTGYAELLRFKGLIGRLDSLDRSLARQADPVLYEQVRGLSALERRLSGMANAVPSFHDTAETKAWQETYAALSAERQAKTRSLARAFEPFRDTLEGKEVGPAEVQRALGAHEVLIDVLLSYEHYLAFVVAQTGAVVRLDLGEATNIEPAAVAFAQATQRHGVVLPGGKRGLTLEGQEAVTDTEAWLKAGQALRELIFAPLEARLPEGTTTLYLVLDGALAAVPFAALPGREAGRQLIDDYHLTHLSMTQQLVPGKEASAPGKGALLVGGVDYDKADALEEAATPSGSPAMPSPVLARLDRAPRGGHFSALAGTGPEVDGLAKQLGDGATVLLASQATESGLRSLAVGKLMLHFATHGFVRTDLMIELRPRAQDEKRWMTGGMERHLAVGHDPMLLAGLAMAGANPRDGADGDDGILTAAEASYMDLSGCDLVVLSACETATGTPESGEGVLGLVHGFELAGVKHVVGSLWKVDDDATRLLMGKFYEGVLRKEQPLSPAEALREAAMWLRDSKPGGRDYSSPRYWAAFVAYGR